jgi:iron complex outermembrane receptor protein
MRLKKLSRWLIWCASSAGALCHASAADDRIPAKDVQFRDLANFDLETLMKIEVTSPAKKEQKLSDSPTAIYVITQDDIRRSGLTTLPELLRMAPGMEVARVNASQWAVSARGFNDPYADKLLVLVDGRTVYTPSFGGVFWTDQGLVLEDLQRIEIIRGPGATLWGANAVNGVVNIITKKTSETQGLLVSSAYGTLEQPSTSIRYGGAIDPTLHYRVYAKYFNHDNFEDAGGADMHDDWRIANGGFRLDWDPNTANSYTLDSQVFDGRVGEQYRVPQLTPPYETLNITDNHNRGGHALARWTHTVSDDQEFSLQAYYDRSVHQEFGVEVRQDTFDLEWQHRFKPIARNEIVWGAGYRYLPDELSTGPSINWIDSKTHHQLVNIFAQDEMTLVQERLKFTFGTKFEHNDYTGVELQPSGRLIYTPTDRQSLWAAVSRAVRTPTRADTSLIGDFRTVPTGAATPPLVLRTYGNPDFKSEQVIAYELGYRVEPHKRVSLDIAAFVNRIDGLSGFTPGTVFFEGTPAPHLVQPAVTQNVYSGYSYGAEVSATWTPMDHLRIDAGYSWIGFDLRPDNSRGRTSPKHQVHVRSYLDLPHAVQLMGAAYYVSSVSTFDGLATTEIPSYIRVDVGVTWRPIDSLEVGVWGQNLLDPGHPEFTSYQTSALAEVPRAIVGEVTWSW